MGIRHPLARLDGSRLSRLTVVSALAAGLCVVFLYPAGEQLKTEAAPLGIVSFEMAGSRAAMDSILEAWGEEGRALARAATWVDMVFLAGYGLFLSCVSVALGRRARDRGLAGPGLLGDAAAWAAWLAAGLDLAENVVGLRILAGASQPEAAAMAAAAALKFLLVAAVFACLAVGAFLVVRRGA